MNFSQMEMALAAHSVPMFLHPLAYGVGNLDVPYSYCVDFACIPRKEIILENTYMQQPSPLFS